MKRKILIIFGIVFILSGLLAAVYMFYSSKFIDEKPEQIIMKLKDIKSYSSVGTLEIKNSRQTLSRNINQFYKNGLGHRLEIEGDRIFLYSSSGSTFVRDLKNLKEYQLNECYDELFKYTFIDKYIELIYTNEEMDIKEVKENDKEYLLLALLTNSTNDNINSGVLWVNKKNHIPEKLLIFNKENQEVARVTYTSFNILAEFEDSLFKLGKWGKNV